MSTANEIAEAHSIEVTALGLVLGLAVLERFRVQGLGFGVWLGGGG